MKIKIDDCIIEHNDVKSICMIVENSINRYIHVEYIEAKQFQKIPDSKVLIHNAPRSIRIL